MKSKFKVISVIAILAMLLCSFPASADSETYTVATSDKLGDLASVLREMPEEITVAELEEIVPQNLKILNAYEPFLVEGTYKTLKKAYGQIVKNGNAESVEAFLELWAGLEQTKPLEGNVWYLWDDDNTPVLDGEEFTDEDFVGNTITDNADYKPFVIKYLLDDPSTAKGNILLNSGGERTNTNEAYPAAELFNELGYNCFIVNRRSLPYSYEDKSMDLQRAIRLVKYYAEQEGWGGQDMIAAYGASAGGIVILGCVNVLYGDTNPTVYDADYVPDEIDQINSDLDVSITVYFGGTEIEDEPGVPDYAKPEFLLNEENPNWPAMFLCSGVDDTYGADGTAQKIYDQVNEKVPAFLHLIEGANHGFGIGSEDVPESLEWPYEADEFMQANR